MSREKMLELLDIAYEGLEADYSEQEWYINSIIDLVQEVLDNE